MQDPAMRAPTLKLNETPTDATIIIKTRVSSTESRICCAAINNFRLLVS